MCETDVVNSLQDLAFNKIYIISSKNISIFQGGHQTCTRRKCENKNDCGFIPNYPTLKFNKNSRTPSNGWYEIDKAATVLNSIL